MVDTAPAPVRQKEKDGLQAVEGPRARLFSFLDGLAFVAIVVVIFFATVLGVSYGLKLAHLTLKPGDNQATSAWGLLGELFQMIAVAGGVVAYASWKRGGLSFVGFAPQQGVRAVLLGLLAGLGLQTAIIVGLSFAGLVQFAPMTFALPQSLGGLAIFVSLFVAVAFVEEGAMRGPLLNAFSGAFGFWPGAILTSLIFMGLHLPNTGESVIGLANVFWVGVVLAWTRQRTGALWFAIGFHAAWDFAQSYIFGVPDSGQVMRGALTTAVVTGPDWLSGGPTGPEGGVLTTISIALLAGICALTWRKDKIEASKGP